MGRWKESSKDWSREIKPRPHWRWSLQSYPTLRLGGRAFELVVHTIIGFLVMVVGGASQVVTISQEQDSEVSPECTSCKGDLGRVAMHVPQQVYLQHNLRGGTAGAKRRCIDVVWIGNCQIALHKACINLHSYTQHLECHFITILPYSLWNK